MRCIYADPDNLNKFNQSDAGLLAQMYLQLSKSGGRVSAPRKPSGRNRTIMPIHLVDVVAPVVVATLFIGATSTFKEPQRRHFNAIMIAGAGAAYLNGGLGIARSAISQTSVK